MFNEVEGLFTQVVVNVNPFWVTCVCHAMIADEYNVDDFGEVASLQSVVEITSENVNGLQCILFYL